MWKENASAFFGLAVSDSMITISSMLFYFRLFPVALFCTSPTDACSCQGGGFEIYEPFCNAVATEVAETKSNKTSSSGANITTLKTFTKLTRSKTEYKGIFEVLAAEVAVIATSIGAIVLIIVVFSTARLWIAYINAHDAKALAEMKAARDKEENLRLKVSRIRKGRSSRL